MELDSIAELLIDRGMKIQVAKNIYVKLAKISLISTKSIELTKDIELKYWFFKPKVRYTDYLTCEEIK
jgi:hypothetical protein